MATKRHFTGKPIGQEYESSEDSELESEAEDEVNRQHKNIKSNISIKPIERKEVAVPKDADDSINEKIKVEAIRKEESEDDEEDEEEESEDSEDSDEDSSEESSDDEPKLLRPVFITKSKRSKRSKETLKTKEDKALVDRERTLKTIETHINQDIEYRKQLKEATQNYGGIDDTDDLDPEAERAAYEIRKKQREDRDRARLEQEQDELEELENRRLMTEEDRAEELRQSKSEEPSAQPKVKGAFFREEELLKRDLGDDNEKYDKSLLPQRFKPEKL